MSYPTRPQSHQQCAKPLPTEFEEIRGLQKTHKHTEWGRDRYN